MNNNNWYLKTICIALSMLMVFKVEQRRPESYLRRVMQSVIELRQKVIRRAVGHERQDTSQVIQQAQESILLNMNMLIQVSFNEAQEISKLLQEQLNQFQEQLNQFQEQLNQSQEQLTQLQAKYSATQLHVKVLLWDIQESVLLYKKKLDEIKLMTSEEQNNLFTIGQEIDQVIKNHVKIDGKDILDFIMRIKPIEGKIPQVQSIFNNIKKQFDAYKEMFVENQSILEKVRIQLEDQLLKEEAKRVEERARNSSNLPVLRVK